MYGVTSVHNELDVRIVDEHGRQDADLRGAVLQAMALDGLIPKTVDAKADRGLVTLTGTAAWQYQRQEAEFVAGNVPGVVDVDNQIALTTAADGRRRQAGDRAGVPAEREPGRGPVGEDARQRGHARRGRQLVGRARRRGRGGVGGTRRRRRRGPDRGRVLSADLPAGGGPR